MPTAPDLLVTRLPGLLETPLDDEIVGLHIDNGAAYGFNRTATRVWALTETPRSLAAICDALVGEYAVERAECEAEVRRLLAEFAREGLVTLAPVRRDR